MTPDELRALEEVIFNELRQKHPETPEVVCRSLAIASAKNVAFLMTSESMEATPSSTPLDREM